MHRLAAINGDGPWLLSGDFNTILSMTDRILGAPVTVHEIKDFSECVDVAGLFEVKSVGHFYSSRKGAGSNKTASRIDRAFGNAQWMNDYGDVVADYFLTIHQFL